MGTEEILEEISQQSLEDQIMIIEKTIRLIRKNSHNDKLKNAAELMYDEYKNDPELTAFKILDSEEIYEAR